MAWTQFMDMHSGGGTKVKNYENIYIEAPRDEAISLFQSLFLRDPYHVSCECCGEDYSITESESLERATAYERGCHYNRETGQYEERPAYSSYVPLSTYLKRKDIKVVRTKS